MVKPFGAFYVICGIILSFLSFIYPASVFYITVIFIISYLLYKKVHDSERSFILYIFYSSLFLRLVFIIVTHILSSYYGFGPKSTTFPGMGIEGGAIIGDDIGIHARAWALANMVKGVQLSDKETEVLLKFGEYGWSFHVYFLSFFYYLFGTVPFLGKCINALFGVLTGIIVYFISKELFGIKTAKLAGILTVFYPTLFLWSITNLKDTALIFLLTFIIYSYIVFFKRKRMRYLFLLPVLFFLISKYRLDLIFPLIFASVVSLIINIRWNYKKFVASVVILVIFLNSHILYNHCSAYIKPIQRKLMIEQFIGNQRGHVSSGGSVYKIYPERFYEYGDSKTINTKEFVISLIKGTLSLMFRPFLWEIDNKAKLLFYPVQIIWNILFPFFIVGLLVSLRYQIKGSVFLLSTFIIIVILLSLTEGNIGTMIRHRDMVTPIYIIFSSFGIVHLLSKLQFRKVK